MEQHTLVIIGGGPIGIACALEAQRLGIDHLVLEKGTVVNSIYHYPVNMTFFSTSERLEIGGVPFVTTQPKPKRAEALEYYRRVVQDRRVHLRLFEEVTAVDDDADGFIVRTSKGAYRARFVVIATGFYDIPYSLGVPGEDLIKVKHYYDDPHYYAFQKVLIVGAQNSAVDAALETWRKGAQVTMVIRGTEIGQRVKYWVRPDIINRIEEGSIKAYFDSNVTEITERTVEIQTPGGPVSIENDLVLALTGYQPNLPFLRHLGIRLGDDAVCQPQLNAETHESNRPGIYLAGVICGGMNTHRLFIENSREHAVKILADIRSRLPDSKK
ncbi:YpdA family putative bacillithiol disulfide reductase [Flaviaesturariibacter aridisoli]|uniref:YpdA family putative bacillithiol disulfide reductase n=1 Tax=Flaviaesturariibacter aridisoli TaxID=2545761 RepID=A0A4V2WN29_9BACT|nr:YpdA family putative bacillithiol disulfide reductase [Flaviaesturariibacter aridisoli]TCZ73912.1 YpdA family putative bacillithiol disulfide reductase [Flaviaesturariibacter aridisoli]